MSINRINISKTLSLFRAIIFTLIFTAGISCSSKNIEVSLSSDQEKLPAPKFSVKNLSNEGQLASYTNIVVYDISSDCEPPECPVNWHAVVSDRSSPEAVYYGVLPSFGSLTVSPPKVLRPGHKYLLKLGQDASAPRKDYGTLLFTVSDSGSVSEIPEK